MSTPVSAPLTGDDDATGQDLAAPASRAPSTRFVRRFTRKPSAMIALAWLVFVTAAVVGADLVAPYGPEDQDLTQVLVLPTPQHLLGSGELGLDVLSRLLHGGRITLFGVLVSVIVYTVFGLSGGLLAGYLGGWVDKVILRIADVVYAVPVIIVLLTVLSVFPNNETFAMVMLGLLGAPGLARVVRSVAQQIRKDLYVRAAEASGLSAGVIMRRHVLPGLLGPVIVHTSLFATAAIGLETALGFLGLGVRDATWGTMVGEASRHIGDQPWLLIPSGLTIASFILALGLIGDGARDASQERGVVAPVPRQPRRGRPVTTGEAGEDARVRREGAILSVTGLTVTFPVAGVDTVVVQDVTFDVLPGEALGVLGESGCGKTVTAMSILGLLRPGGRIVGGSVVFEGQELTGAASDVLRRVRGGRIGWVSQDPISSLDPSFTIGSQVAAVVRSHSDCSRAEAKQRALTLLAEVRLPDPEATYRLYPHQLSGGMAQRVGIAAALAARPALVIADEPTTALDVTVQAEILDLLRSLREQGTAIILVTHDWGVVSDLCDEAVVMYAGQIVERAPLGQMIHTPQHPYTAALLRSNPHGATPGEPLATIEGQVPPPESWPLGCHFADRCALMTEACVSAPVPLVAAGSGRTSRCIHRDQVMELAR